MEIKDTLKKNLDGEALANALGFVDYVTGKGLTPIMEWDNGVRFVKNEKSPCLVVFNMQNSGDWFICDIPAASEPEWDSLDTDLKNFILANVKVCDVHQGNPCGCGNEPGVSKTLFGKEYHNVCTSEIQLINPTPDVLDTFKEIIDWWAINVAM